MNDKTMTDAWDQLDSENYWQPMAPVTAEQYFSGEVPGIFIRFDIGKWWVSAEGEATSADYETLEEAKAAGQSVLDEGYARMDAAIVADLGVDTAEWEVVIEDGVIGLTLKSDPEISIVGDESRKRWSVYSGDDILSEHIEFSAAMSSARAVNSAGSKP